MIAFRKKCAGCGVAYKLSGSGRRQKYCETCRSTGPRFRAFQPIENKGSTRRHLDTHTPPDIGEFVRAQIVAQKDQPNPVTFTLPDGRKGRVWLEASGIGDARHWRLNIAEADRIDRLAIAHQRMTGPVDSIGGPRRGQVDQHLRYGILDVESALIDEDQSRAGAPQGDDYPLTYDASGYPELLVDLPEPPPRAARTASPTL